MVDVTCTHVYSCDNLVKSVSGLQSRCPARHLYFRLVCMNFVCEDLRWVLDDVIMLSPVLLTSNAWKRRFACSASVPDVSAMPRNRKIYSRTI